MLHLLSPPKRSKQQEEEVVEEDYVRHAKRDAWRSVNKVLSRFGEENKYRASDIQAEYRCVMVNYLIFLFAY